MDVREQSEGTFSVQNSRGADRQYLPPFFCFVFRFVHFLFTHFLHFYVVTVKLCLFRSLRTSRFYRLCLLAYLQSVLLSWWHSNFLSQITPPPLSECSRGTKSFRSGTFIRGITNDNWKWTWILYKNLYFTLPGGFELSMKGFWYACLLFHSIYIPLYLHTYCQVFLHLFWFSNLKLLQLNYLFCCFALMLRHTFSVISYMFVFHQRYALKTEMVKHCTLSRNVRVHRQFWSPFLSWSCSFCRRRFFYRFHTGRPDCGCCLNFRSEVPSCVQAGRTQHRVCLKMDLNWTPVKHKWGKK